MDKGRFLQGEIERYGSSLGPTRHCTHAQTAELVIGYETEREKIIEFIVKSF